MELTIIYEDEDIVAIDKPAGLVVHGDGKTNELSLSDWFLKKFPKATSIGEPLWTASGAMISRPGIVHRLDRKTSGVILLAKTSKGFDCLKKQFQSRDIKKEYQAFVFGEMKTNKGTINRPIGRSKNDFRKWSAQRGARGEMREATTQYEVKEKAGGYSFVYIFPKTGRTHQIRVHFKAINYPLVGDSLYAGERKNDLGLERLALHSHKIIFKNTAGHIETVTAPEPADFKVALAKLQSL